MLRTRTAGIARVIAERTEAYRRTLEAAAERLRGNDDFCLLFGDDGLAQLAQVASPAGTEASRRRKTPTAPRKRSKPTAERSTFAEKRGSRVDAIQRVLRKAARWLEAEELRDLLPSEGYSPDWQDPAANLRAVIQETRRKGEAKLVRRDGKFGLPEWLDADPREGAAQ
jgi:hypothetical protein